MSLRDYLYHEEPGITLYCGDSRDILPMLSVSAIITDPPYGNGVNYLSFDDSPGPAYWAWMRDVLGLMRRAAPIVAFTHRNAALAELDGWDWIGVWNKIAAGGVRVGNSPLVAQWEPIFFYGIHSIGTKSEGRGDVFDVLPARAGNINGGVGRAKWNTGSVAPHPCPKPVSLMSYLIRCVGQKAEVILDPFAGSGTTLRAAKDLSRRVIGIEIEPTYCEIAVKRLRQEVLL